MSNWNGPATQTEIDAEITNALHYERLKKTMQGHRNVRKEVILSLSREVDRLHKALERKTMDMPREVVTTNDGVGIVPKSNDFREM